MAKKFSFVFMKKALLLVGLLFITLIMVGQAKEGTVKSNRIQQPAAVIELPYPSDIVSAAINDYLSKKGRSKGNDIKGFSTFRNTQPLHNDVANADLYLRVERKSNQEKGKSIISLLLTAPKDDRGTEVDMHYMNMEQAKEFLDQLVPAIEAYNLEQQIKDQNESVTKAESRYKSLTDDGADLEKKRAGIEKKQQENLQDQQTQKTEIENQKQKLATLVSQRKS